MDRYKQLQLEALDFLIEKLQRELKLSISAYNHIESCENDEEVVYHFPKADYPVLERCKQLIEIADTVSRKLDRPFLVGENENELHEAFISEGGHQNSSAYFVFVNAA